ncbi:MAG TPA: FtsX-like permease family protein [Candidatus Cloacimonetes bacterium]|nr:FtsX-like permease family protein [Candidatus Cloacimonadota bacterium]
MDVSINPLWWDSWENLTLTGYIRVRNNSIPAEVERKIIQVARDNKMASVFTPKLQPLLDMHLKSMELRYDAFNLNKSDVSIVYSLLVIAFLVLLVASINFINLSRARSSKKGKEISMRKVVDSNKRHLSIQFLGESILLTLIAMLIALALVEVFLPHLQPFLNKRLEFNIFKTPYILPFMLVMTIIIGILSEIYPALMISSFKPVKILKGGIQSGKKGTTSRRILVVSQFTVSIALILSVLIVISQIKYLESIDFGYKKDNILVVPAFDENITYQNDLFKEQIKSIPAVISATRVRQLPGATLPTAEVFFDHKNGDFGIMFAELFIDENFIETLDIDLLTGRNFSRDFPVDSSSSVLINETALKMSGWDDPLGKEIIHIPAEGTDNYLTVVGVIKDIHFGKATRKVEPMVIHFDPRSNFLLIRTNGTQVEKTKEDLEMIFKEIWEERNFRIFDFSEIFNNQFFNEISFANKIIVFASSAIFIACLGLFGLAVFITEQKTKEIGIWKVLGSSVRSVVFLLSKDFAKWVLLSNLIAWPLAYFAMNNWLQNFAYRTKINFWLFILSGMIALIISIITVSFQTIKAANADPVKSLKYE